MQRSAIFRVATLLLFSLGLYACATYYKEPSSSSSRALISSKQKNCIIGCKDGVFIRAINNVEVSNMWKTNGYYVNPEPTLVTVAVSDIGLFGVCVMKINALEGEEYMLSHEVDGTNFIVTAYDKGGASISSCVARMGPAPAGATYIPMIVPVN